MNDAFPANPFTPGAGHVPPTLAGRGEETRLLEKMLGRLTGDGAAGKGRRGFRPCEPVTIVGPRGGGKTALLNWMRRRAEERGILKCAIAVFDHRSDGVEHLIATALAVELDLEIGRPELHKEIVAPGSTFANDLEQGRPVFDALVRAIVAKEPLLLTMDEIHRCDLLSLRALLETCQQIIAEGLPLAVVMAGPPELGHQLRKADADFLDHSKNLHINLLSDEAARDAMRVPLERGGFALRPAALAAMAAQTENYPYFIQLMGEAVWAAAVEAGVTEIDAGLVAQVAEGLRSSQRDFHTEHCHMLGLERLASHAFTVVKLLECGGGAASAKVILEALAESSAERGGDSEEIHALLQENGLIWTVDGETRTGRPALYERFKERCRLFAGGGFAH